jgi:hypothetical protein
LLPPLFYLAWRGRLGAAGAVAALLVALALGQDMGGAAGAQDLVGQLRQGVVMWHMSYLPPPPELAALPASGLIHFYGLALLHAPLWLLELAGLRLFWLLFYAYPPHHPLWYAVVAPLLALYLAAAWGTWRAGRARREAWLVWGFLGAALVVAALSWVTSDGRFLTRPLCCLVFLAGLGLEPLLPGRGSGPARTQK